MCRLSLVLVVCLLASPLAAQDAKKAAPADAKKAAAPSEKSAPAKAAPKSAAPADFATLYKQWKEELAHFAQIRSRFQTDVSADRNALQVEAQEVVNRIRDMLEPVTVAALKEYQAAPNKNPEVTDFLMGALNGFMISDDYEIAARICHVLVDNKCDKPELDHLSGIAFFMTNDFDDAQQHLQAAKDKKITNQNGLRCLDLIDKYKELWGKEKEIRAGEDKVGDLPKVRLTTTQGDIVVELFENEAPNTTANFISLVESKFYDGLSFHRVIPGFMAQGGDPKGDGSGGPGYTIPDECRQDNHRNHFRGSLSMAKTQAPDTGGSQFFINLAPTSHLNGQHTVFGRVVEGMRVLAKLQRTEGIPGKPAPPDKILKATVISKRPHEYKPIKRLDAAK